MEDHINIKIAYISADIQSIISLSVPKGTTIKNAILHAELLKKYPAINLDNNKVGIFGNIKPLSYQLKQDERVEIYCPSIVDPKEMRRRKAKRTC